MICRLFLMYGIFILLSSCERKVPFDSEKWKSSGGELIQSDIRLQMVRDLLERDLLLHKKRTEIDSLLGLPALTNLTTSTKKSYSVREVYSTDIDPDEIIYLIIEFNDKGKSINIELFKE